MIVRAVIFDFNGILADDDPIHMQALLKVAREEGLNFTAEEYLERYLPLNDWDCFRELWKSRNKPLGKDDLESLIRRKSDYYFQEIRGRSVLFEGTAKAVGAAAARGPVGIASGARHKEISHILREADLLEYFAAIVAAEDVQHGKPHPEPFRLAWERLAALQPGLRIEDCLAVEDSIGGIESARAAGMPCLAIAHSYSRSRLEGKAQWVINSISDFADWLKKYE
jgi:HAD superfamily hydrolase (TIGR01509 family)